MSDRELIALKPLKVHLLDEEGNLRFEDGPDGKKIPVHEMRQPGDPVPEAKTWSNLRAWVSMGHVGVDGDARTMEVLAGLRNTTPGDAEDSRKRTEAAVARTRKKPGPRPGSKRKAAATKAPAKAEPTGEPSGDPGSGDASSEGQTGDAQTPTAAPDPAGDAGGATA